MKSEKYVGNDGKYHFVYITKVHDKITGITHRYFGKHSTNRLDDGYIGSGSVLSMYANSHRAKRGEIEISSEPYLFFDSSDQAYEFEGLLVTEDFLEKVDNILNLRAGGFKTAKDLQAEGIARAKARGAFKGRAVNTELHGNIKHYLTRGMKAAEVAKLCECSLPTVYKIKKELEL